MVDTDTRVVVVNEAAAELFGVPVEELMDRPLSAIPVDLLDDRGHLLPTERLPLVRALRGEEVTGMVVRFVRRDGSLLWVEVHSNPLHDADGKLYGAVASYDDVTARVEQDRRVRHEADHDSLTGLANRRALERTLDAALARAGARARSVGVIMLDLDGFKAINDTHGHAAGDQALREVASRLRRCVRERDLVARLGGDEFVVVLTDLGGRSGAVQDSVDAHPRGAAGAVRGDDAELGDRRRHVPVRRRQRRRPAGPCRPRDVRRQGRAQRLVAIVLLSVESPVILTCAVSGALASREQCPAIPYTPAEYAAEARRACDEGAVMIHLHARTVGRHAVVRDRGLPRDHRGDPRRGRRRADHQLLDGCAGRADRDARRVPARARARGGGAEHGLDELREVLGAAEGLRVQGRVRELVRHDRRVVGGDGRLRASGRSTSASTPGMWRRWIRCWTWAC